MTNYKDIENANWDVIVVGAGMGGSTVGYELARQGRSVLFLERGTHVPSSESAKNSFFEGDYGTDEHTRLDQGHWPNKIEGKSSFGKRNSYLSLGCGVGGSSILYAAQLERMHKMDFEPKKNYPNVIDSTLPDCWPIDFQEFVPYYKKAEKLFGVTGSRDPLNLDDEGLLVDPPPLTQSNNELFKCLIEFGLNPYRSHVACEFVDGCEGCAGVACHKNCKNDAGKICVKPAINKYGAKILTNCEVLKLNATDSEIKSLECKIDKAEIKLSAKVVILAAGAFFTPELLFKSKSDIWPSGLANRSGYVGKNLMWHVSDVFAIKPRHPRGKYESGRQISFNDFYFSDGKKMGNIQEMGFNWFTKEKLAEIIKNRLTKFKLKIFTGNFFLHRISKIAHWYFNGATMYASVIEDLPYLHNRVFLKNGKLAYEYHYTNDLKMRSKFLRVLLQRRLKSKYKLVLLSKKDNINYGHASGTCRFGVDPKTSVLNSDNRAHDIKNLFIVDASFFPSSGGVNPSLTIAANAIRVAEKINSNWDMITA